MTVGDLSAASSTVALQLPVREPRGTAAEPRRHAWSEERPGDLARCAEEAGARLDDLAHAAFALLLHRCSGQPALALGRTADPAPGGQHPSAAAEFAVPALLDEETPLPVAAAALARLREERAASARGPAALGAGLRAGSHLRREGVPLPEGYDLLLEIGTEQGALDLVLHHDAALLEPAFAARMAVNLGVLLRDAAARPDAPAGRLSVLSAEESHRLLTVLNDTGHPYDTTATVHGLVEAQAARTPEAPAVDFGGTVWTYRQLDEQANRLARALGARGLAPGARVGVSLERTHRTVALLLAVHKAGCAYVPLDPAYPADRLRTIAATAGMSLVVHEGEQAPGWLAGTGVPGLPSGELWEKAASEPGSSPQLAVRPEDTTHLIHTSGSTGLPKGVVISHRNVVALLAWAEDTYPAGDLARVLFSTSLNFDLSVYELWAPLTRGGCVVVVGNVLALTEDPGFAPTLVNTVPSALNVLLQRGAVPDSVRVLNVAGEPLSRELVDTAFAQTSVERLYNLYGPSEDTTYSTWKCFTGPVQGQPTIGVPVHNTRAYLLDPEGRPVPLGAVGELHLGGDKVADGYLDDPERTAAAFLPAPADPRPGRPACRLYRTGDLARWTEDGELRFLGRKDNQVKVRGFRIELGEIESVLREVVGLRDVAALAVRTAGDTRLVCWVGLDGAAVTAEEMSAHLRAKLPHYMQPAKILLEERLPVLPNGKVDRKALAARPVDWGRAGAAAFTGEDPEEREVADAWTELLGLPQLAAELDFFSVGGHSLLANLLAARLGDTAGRPVRVAEIYAHRTLAAQAELLRRKRAEAPAAGTAAGGPGRAAAVAATLRESARGHGVPGAGVAVLVDGRVECTYHGLADVAAGTPYGPRTRQRITCITKPMLAFVALRLVDRGLLGLDQPLDGILPEAFVRRGGERVRVTLRHLLSHTSGVDDSYEVWHDTDLPDLDSYLATLGEYGQLFAPGEVFAYSAVGTSIVAGVIEKLLGMSWRRAVNELMLLPLGIAAIPETLAENGHYGDDISTGYLWHEPTKSYRPHDPPRQTVADDAAGSFSVCLTLEELAAVARLALDDGVAPSGERLLSAELAAEMRTPQIPVPGHHFMHAWGLGWLMFGPSAFGFNSNGSGHHNFVQIFPEEGTFLLLLANAYPAFGLYEDLLRELTGEGLIRTGRPFEMELDDCPGVYASDGYRLHVLRGEEHLRYEYAERAPNGSWRQLDEGSLVLSGAGGFSSMSERNVLAGSISFIPAPGSATPGFVRIGQRFARRTR
ncbi:amino acid adenylation domain-containing protein [Streptomyces sp. SCSIO ZS0520]|uniref:amino acid adenylation domain-containing protein n=1 Tax=Streptomyces sp. SCSIO ZS0520 TaxID=2892996 RepID=UPI0021D817C1|nr:amino acid adenylation domain-containing protein [Streptomyces sp. SCSIO ZS0520]